MNTLFPIEDYKQISHPEIKPVEHPYFCVGFYPGRGWFQGRWKIFSEMWVSEDNPHLLNFIKQKESSGWIMLICKLPDFTKVKQ